MISFIFNFRKCELIYSDRKQITDCLEQEGREPRRLRGGTTRI